MRNFIEDNPWTTFLGLLGLVIGILLPSGLNILVNMDFSQASKDPLNFITGYVVAVPLAMFVEIISGLIGTLFGAIIGMLIDGKNYHGGHY